MVTVQSIQAARVVVPAICLTFYSFPAWADHVVLEVKAGRSAIVKQAPSGDARRFDERLLAGTRVVKTGDAPRYYQIRMEDGRVGWLYYGVDAPHEAIGKDAVPAVSESIVKNRTAVSQAEQERKTIEVANLGLQAALGAPPQQVKDEDARRLFAAAVTGHVGQIDALNDEKQEGSDKNIEG